MSEVAADMVALAAVAFVWLLAGGIGVGMMIPHKPDVSSKQLKVGVFAGPIMLGLAIGVRL